MLFLQKWTDKKKSPRIWAELLVAEGEAGLRVCFFLHVRRVGADGHISSLLRPERYVKSGTITGTIDHCQIFFLAV